MISLNGPQFVEAGSTVCLTASNVGAGFSATSSSSGSTVSLTVKIDPVTHVATICFTAPNSGAGVVVHVADNAGPKGTSYTVISR